MAPYQIYVVFMIFQKRLQRFEQRIIFHISLPKETENS